MRLKTRGNPLWFKEFIKIIFHTTFGIAAALIVAPTAHAQYPGADACAYGPCINTVPCRHCNHCNGTWTDSYGATWTLDTNYATLSVFGTERAPNPAAGCPATIFQVSGSITLVGGSNEFIRGYTQMNLTTSNPNPSTPCGGYQPRPSTATLTLRNDGCDIAAGTLTTDGYNYSVSVAKPAEIPTGEMTEAVGWWSLQPTIHQFRQTLEGASPFDGRQVTEAPGGTAQDDCFYQGAAEQGIPAVRRHGRLVGCRPLRHTSVLFLLKQVDRRLCRDEYRVSHFLSTKWSSAVQRLC